MQQTQKPYKPGSWVLLGPALGAFIGLLFGKFAIGLIFGFFLGVMIDSSKRKAIAASAEKPPENEENK